MGGLEDDLSDGDVERLLGTVPAHFCKTTADGRFLWLSPGWEELLGIPLDELGGRPFIDYIHPDDLERTGEAMAQLDEGRPVVDFVNRYRRSDGSCVWLRCWIRSLQPVSTPTSPSCPSRSAATSCSS